MTTTMMSNKERACIEKSRKAQLVIARARLEELRVNGITFDSPVGGFCSGMEWEENPSERLKKFALLPVALVLMAFLLLLTPCMYILHLWDVYNRKRGLKSVIRKLEKEALSTQVPDEKVLELLWELHGMGTYEYPFAERLNLLGSWIDILYGKEVADNLGLKTRVDEISKRHMETNRSYYEGKDGAPHFFFMPPVESLIGALSEELPPYQ